MKTELIFRRLYLMWLLSDANGSTYLKGRGQLAQPRQRQPRTVSGIWPFLSRPLEAEAALVQRDGLPWDFLAVHVATWRGLCLLGRGVISERYTC